MATSARPALRSNAERRGRAGKSPQLHDAENHNIHSLHDSVALATRRSSRGAPLFALTDEHHPVKAAPPAVAPTAPTKLSRANSKKRSAAALQPDAPIADPRPPTKVTVAQPHGGLLQTINGTQAALPISHDDVPSGASTPKPNGVGALLAVPVQAAGTSTTQDKRSLRSQDGGSRLKSDLTIYFANYDDIIAGLEQSPELLGLETPIYIVDEPLKPTNVATPDPPRHLRKSASLSPNRTRKLSAQTPTRKASITTIPASQSSTTYQTLDYSTIAKHLPKDHDADPLGDTVFFAAHRRAERKEKQLRNIEKERAMHEKVQLERLLDGLQGPDWLKVMGITGVTDGERKDWEPKRDYFVKEVEMLVDKFRIWKEEEKRLRAEKEAAAAAREEEEDDEDEDESVVTTTGAEPESKDIVEKAPLAQKVVRRPPRPHGFVLPVLPPEPQEPFTSFFSKPHLRIAALGKHRHGRNALAFGHPLPEPREQEFRPPEELLTVEALRDHARKRRRQKREGGTKKD